MAIRFYKHRYVYFAISIAVILTGLICLLVNGISLDIQFKGGSILKYTYTGEIDAEQAAAAVEAAIGRETSCLIQYNMAKDERMLIVNLAEDEALTSQEQQAVTDALTAKYPDQNLDLSESLTVAPFIGARFFKNGIIAIVVSFLLIQVYVAFRF
jgi:preprotein translocase subunit SecF